MFKSKYGLISALLIIATTAGIYLWVNSRVNSKVQCLASEQLAKNDALMRHIEDANRNSTLALGGQVANIVTPKVNAYYKELNKLDSIMEKQMTEFETRGEFPVFVTVTGKPHGSQNHETVFWMSVNGTNVSRDNANQWFDAAEIKGLISKVKMKTPVEVKTTVEAPVAETKPEKKAAKNKKADKKAAKDDKKDDKTVPASNIVVPLVFPGESEGRYVAKPYEDPSLSAIPGVKFVLRMHIVNVVSKSKDGTLIPVPGGSIIAGFRGGKISKEEAARLLLRIARSKDIRSLPYRIDANREEIFKALTKARAHNNFQVQGQMAHILALVDARGNVITRDRDDSKIRGFNYLKSYKSAMDIVSRVVKSGISEYDILEHEVINRFQQKSRPSNLYNAAIIPVISTLDGKVDAVFLTAWPFDVRQSQASSVSQVKTAFFYDRNIFFPTFKGTAELKDLEETLNGRFADVRVSPAVANPKARIKGERFKFANEEFLGALFQYPDGLKSGKKYGYIVLVSVSRLEKPFKGIGGTIIGIGIFALLLLFVLEFLIFGYFYKAIDAVDEGLQEISAGDTDYVFGRISPETEGLSNSLNEMLDVLFGRETLDENGEATEKRGMQLVKMGNLPETPYLGDDSRVKEYVSMQETQYMEQLYAKFQAAWKKLGEEDDVPSKDLFEQRVRLYERMVLKNMQCDRVLFEVTVSDDSINLEPLPIS